MDNILLTSGSELKEKEERRQRETHFRTTGEKNKRFLSELNYIRERKT